MSHLFWLSDKAWARIEPLLPHGKQGKPRVDDRSVISGFLHVLKNWRRQRAMIASRKSIWPPSPSFPWSRNGLKEFPT